MEEGSQQPAVTIHKLGSKNSGWDAMGAYSRGALTSERRDVQATVVEEPPTHVVFVEPQHNRRVAYTTFMLACRIEYSGIQYKKYTGLPPI